MAASSGANLLAQTGVISSASLTPFNPRDVGTTSAVKTVRIRLNHPLSVSTIAVAPGFTEFTAGAVSGCTADGLTVNPVFTVCEVPVTFQPKYPGYRTAPLILTDGSGNKYSVGLQGTGLAPLAALTPGIIDTVAGVSTHGLAGKYSGDDGPATEAYLWTPNKTALDAAGDLYIADTDNDRIRKVDTSGIITTIAGNGKFGFSGDGGPATSAELIPISIALDAAGNLFVADSANNRIRKIDVAGIITTVAGNGARGFSGDDGPATEAELDAPADIAIDNAGNWYIADSLNERIRKVDTNGVITTFAGSGSYGGDPGFCDVIPNFAGDGGPATSALLGDPDGVATDNQGNVYVADRCNIRIREVNTSGVITTVAGNGGYGQSGDGGPARSAHLSFPLQVTVDAAGNFYLVDTSNRVRRVDVNGTINTVAGNGKRGSGENGQPATGASMDPESVTVDATGNLYIADSGNSVILKVSVNQSAANFASLAIGSTSPSTKIVLTNVGNQHIDLTMPDITGDFNLLSGIASDCTDTPELGAGFSCALRITFSPTEAGPLTGTATTSDNSLNAPGTTQQVSLTGTGVNP